MTTENTKTPTGSTTKTVTEEALHAYAGKNGEYYARFLTRYQRSATFLSWNWVAFFFLPIWLAYRKLWWPLVTIIGLEVIVTYLATRMMITGLSPVTFKSMTFDQLLLFPVIIVIGFIGLGIVLLANSFYLKQAAQHIHNSDGELNTLHNKGRSVFAGILLFVLFGGVSGAYFSWQVLLQGKGPSTLSGYVNDAEGSGFSTNLLSSASSLKTLKTQLDAYNYHADTDHAELLGLLDAYDDLSYFNNNDQLLMGEIVYFPFREDDFALLQVLIDKRLNIEAIARSLNRDFLASARKDQRWAMMRFLIEKAGFKDGNKYLMKPASYDDRRPLQVAIKAGELSSVRWMIERNIPITAKYYKGLSPLMVAVKAKQPDIVRLLLAKGANPNYKDLQGQSAATLALEIDNEAIIALFAKSLSKDSFSIEALNNAISKGNIPLAKKMIDTGMDLNRPSKQYDKQYPLEMAISVNQGSKSQRVLVKYLIDHGADVNQPYNGGKEVPLYRMLYDTNGTELMAYAIDHGAKLDFKRNGSNLLDLATRQEWMADKAQLLIKRGMSLTD